MKRRPAVRPPGSASEKSLQRETGVDRARRGPDSSAGMAQLLERVNGSGRFNAKAIEAARGKRGEIEAFLHALNGIDGVDPQVRDAIALSLCETGEIGADLRVSLLGTGLEVRFIDHVEAIAQTTLRSIRTEG